MIVASPDLARVWQAVAEPRRLANAAWIAPPSIPVSASHGQESTRRATAQRLTTTEARVLANTGDAIRSLEVGGAGSRL
jgi:hypothetical protein